MFARRTTVPAPSGYSVIDEAMAIRGEIDSRGTVRVDGRVEGRTHHADTIIIGATGTIVGDIAAREVIVAGAIQGNVVAEGRVEVQASAKVHGDVRANGMFLHEGGVVHGHVTVGEDGDGTAVATDVPRLELRTVHALKG